MIFILQNINDDSDEETSSAESEDEENKAPLGDSETSKECWT